VPNDPGPTSFLPAQYDRFLKGIDQLGAVNSARELRSQARVRVEPGKEPRISIPGWDDIVRTGPRVPVTDEDWKIQRHFERANLPSPLAPAIQEEIKHRRELAQKIRNSATPEYQQGISTMLTAVDNIQDAALTASVTVRITMPVLGGIGPYLAPALGALGTIGTFLNWVAGGLFVLGVAYAAACQGPKAALAAASVPALAGFMFRGIAALLPRSRGIPHPIPGQADKGITGMRFHGIADGKIARSPGGTRWGRMRITFAEALQVAQTSADMTGYGIALGAIMGMISETAYSTTRRDQGYNVTIRSPKVNHDFAKILAPHIAILGPGAAWHREQCARALASAPLILRDPDTFGDTLYGLTWLTVYVSVEPLMWDTNGLHWRETVIDGLPASWYPWSPRDETTRGILEETNTNPDELSVWPVPGAPHALTTEQLVLEIGPEISRELIRWLSIKPDDPWRRFVSELSVRVCERLWYWLEATNEYPRWSLAPHSAVWESLIQADRWPIISDDPNAMMAAFRDCELEVINTGRAIIDTLRLDEIWEARGVPLLRIGTPDDQMPFEHFAPHDPNAPPTPDVAFGRDVSEAREKLRQLLADAKTDNTSRETQN
jgi:hypothetical protein